MTQLTQESTKAENAQQVARRLLRSVSTEADVLVFKDVRWPNKAAAKSVLEAEAHHTASFRALVRRWIDMSSGVQI